jgi:hypothetical protein
MIYELKEQGGGSVRRLVRDWRPVSEVRAPIKIPNHVNRLRIDRTEAHHPSISTKILLI